MSGSSSSTKLNKISGSSTSTKFALVVDDQPFFRQVHKTLLTKLGFETKDVENGKKAVELCMAGDVFDLILMDLSMPVMDGTQATKELRKLGICSKVIGASATENDNEIQEFMKAGLNGFIMKPLNSSKISPFIKELLK